MLDVFPREAGEVLLQADEKLARVRSNGMEQVREEADQEVALALSVIICTRDRADTLLPAVQSVLVDMPPDGSAELLVVDQGRDDSAAMALASILTKDARLRHVREHSVGLSRARNAGLRASRGALIALTDDDCTVEPGWAAALIETFAVHPEVGIICGYVKPAPHDASQGFLPGFEAKEEMLTRKRAFSGIWGIGANMALRRTAWNKLGPFDELLGVGTPLKAAEDIDYILRALTHKIAVYHSARARVIHYGFRPGEQARALFMNYMLATGFMYGKHVRGGSFFAFLLLVSNMWRHIWNVALNALRGRRPLGGRALIYEFQGFWKGLWRPLDRQVSVTCGQVEIARDAAGAQQRLSE